MLILVHVLVLLLVSAPVHGQVQWPVGTEHDYTYESSTTSRAAMLTLKNAHEFPMNTRAKFRVASIGIVGDCHHLLLTIEHIEYIRHEHGRFVSHVETRDLSKWFSFLHSPNGMVHHVRYPPDEDPDVANMKKGLISVLSAHHRPDEDEYTVDDDVDHHGPHSAQYKTRRLVDGTLEIHKSIAQNISSTPRPTLSKRMSVRPDNVLARVTMSEQLLAGATEPDPTRTVRRWASERPRREPTHSERESMQDAFTHTHTRSLIAEHVVKDHSGHSSASIRRSLGHENDIEMVNDDAHDMDAFSWKVNADTDISHAVARVSGVRPEDEPDDLITDTISSKSAPRPRADWTEVYTDILDALDCIESSEMQGSARRSKCVLSLLQGVAQASEENVTWLGQMYLTPDAIPARRASMIDALVEYGSPAAQQAIITQIFDYEKALMADIQRALTGLTTMKAEPSPALLAYMEAVVFSPFNLTLRMQTQVIRVQAMLTIGAMIRGLQARDPARAALLTGRLVAWLYDAGPVYSPRARRSNVEKEADHRIPVLYALGNAAHPDALSHVISHARGESEETLYNTRSHRIRHTAATALGDFEGLAAEQALLETAFTDPNIAVRRRAIGSFRRSPRVLSEHAYPLPDTVPDTPMNRKRQEHREQYRRYLRNPAPPPPPGWLIPDPPSPEAIWRSEVQREATERPGCLPLTTNQAWRNLPASHREIYVNKSIDLWITHLAHTKARRSVTLSGSTAAPANSTQPARKPLFGLELTINITMPSTGWSLPIGSRYLGAEFGLSFGASAIVYFSLLKSSFSLDASANAFGRLYIGFMASMLGGMDQLYILLVDAAFKGHIGFDLSIIMDFDIDDIIRLFNKVQQAATDLMDRLWGAINKFLEALGITGNCGIMCLFKNLLGAIQKLPDIATNIFGVVTSLEDYVGPNATQTIESDRLRRVMQAAYSIVATAHFDINRMYTLVLDTVQVTIPDIANNITGTAKLIVEAIQSLVDCPVAATYALIVSKDHIQNNIARLIFLKSQFEEAFFLTTGELPVWLNPTKEIFRILVEFVSYIKFHAEVVLWNCDGAAPLRPTECLINRTTYDQEMAMRPILGKLSVIGDVLNFVTDTILPPINAVTQLYSDIVNAWDFMKMMYNKARAIFDFLFGVKFHKTFPRTIRPASNSCGTGLYPADDHPESVVKKNEAAIWGAGFDLTPIQSEECNLDCQKDTKKQYEKDSYEKGKDKNSGSSGSSGSSKKKDKYITVPMKGTITYYEDDKGKQDKTILIMRGSAFSVKKFEFLIANLKLLPEVEKAIDAAGNSGWTVDPGWQLGTPNKRSGCEDFIHVSLRLRDNATATEDPQSYVPKAPLGMPEWISEADQWTIKVLNFTVREGTFGALFAKAADGPGREKKGDKATPPKARREIAAALQLVDSSPHSLRARRDVCSEFADAPDMCMAAGFPAFSKHVTFFKQEFTMLVGGVIPVSLGFEIGGEFGVMIRLNFCLLTLKVTVTPVPSAVAEFDVYAAVGKCLILCGGLKITGRVADLKFPLPITIGFKDKPISLTVALDLELIPLAISFSGFAEALSSTIFSATFFEFTMSPITKNIFTLTTKSKDKSPPEFTTPVSVYQDPGHDAKSPGIMLTFKAIDKDTKVEKTSWYVGKVPFSSDLGPETKLDPSVTTSFQPLNIPSQSVAYITVKACNTDDFCSLSTGKLPSWDLDGPAMVAVQAYDFQSHPSQIEAQFSMQDETAVVNNSLWWGFGTAALSPEGAQDGATGDDIWNWVQVSVPPPVDNPIAISMSQSVSINVDFALTHNTIYILNVRSQNALGLWNASSSKGVLIDLITPFPAPPLDPTRCTQEWFDFYARADVWENLTHQGPYIQKVIGCENRRDDLYADGCAITHAIDWQNSRLKERCHGPPTYLNNHRVLRDSGTVFNGHKKGIQTLYQAEKTYLSVNWLPFTDNETGIFMYTFAVGRDICGTDVLDWRDPFSSQEDPSSWDFTASQSELPPLDDGYYYMSIRAYNNIQRGGPLATTVCNTVPLAIDSTKPVHVNFTLDYDDNSSTLIANYFFYDDLSDIRMMQFGLGYSPFDEGLREFSDFYNRTHLGLPGSVLPVGVYMYGRIRAVNHVHLYTTKPSDLPLFLDFTPPIAGRVWDGLALLRQTEFTYIDWQLSCNWAEFYDPESGVGSYKISFSVGLLVNNQWTYDEANPNSTIPWFTATGQDFRITLPLPSGVQLQHNTVYFATVMMIHRGHRKMSVMNHSVGILIDKTCPVFPAAIPPTVYLPSAFSASDPRARCLCPRPAGFNYTPSDMGDLCTRQAGPASSAFIYDGTPDDLRNNSQGQLIDLTYSSSQFTVEAYWGGFADPESAIDYYSVAVGRGVYVNNVLTIDPTAFQDFEIQGLESTFYKSTFFFRPGTLVVTTVRAVNRAGLGTIASTNGYIVDPSPPVLAYLNDGPALPAAGATPVGPGAEQYRRGTDQEYRQDNVALEAHFAFFDLESSIDFYEISVFRYSASGDVRIFPAESNRPSLATNNYTATPALTLQLTDIVMDASLPTSYQAKAVNVRVGASLLSESIFSGTHYYFKVLAWNLAGSSSTSQTNGVFVDFTPPLVDVIRVGVLSDEPEDITAEQGTANIPVVVTSDPFGIRAYWSGSDPQSGVVAYYVAIGLVPRAFNMTWFPPYITGTTRSYDNNPTFVLNCSACNMTYFSASLPAAVPAGSPFAGFIPLDRLKSSNFDITPNRFVEGESNPLRYVITVAAVNGAGLTTVRSSKPFRVAAADIAGTVLDGPDAGIDIAVQDGDTITVTFDGWQTECGGMMGYEWAIGTSPGGSDIQAFTPEGIVMEGDHGTAQVSIDNLAHNVTYYSTVRAVTLCRIQGQQLFDLTDGSTAQITRTKPQPTSRAEYIEAVSSGVLMDRTAPAIIEPLVLSGVKEPDTTKYSLVSPNTTFYLPIPEDNATVHVMVEAEDGRITNYLIDIYPGSPSNVTTLRSITILKPNTLSLLNFSSAQSDYNVSVPFEVSSLTLSAAPTSAAANVLFGVASMVLYPLPPNTESEPVALAVGWTVLALKVYAQDKNTVRVYTISVYRPPPSADCRLSTVRLLWLANSTQTFLANATQPAVLVVPFHTPSLQIAFSSAAQLAQSYVTVTAANTASFNYALIPDRLSPSLPLRGASMNMTVVAWPQNEQTSCSFALTITRAAAANNTNLASFGVRAGAGEAVNAPSITAQNNTDIYLATDASSQVLQLNITTSDIRATIVVDENQQGQGSLRAVVALDTGNLTVFTFDVVAQSGWRTTRTVRVSRRPASSVSAFATLSLDALSLDANTGATRSSLSLANLTSPVVNATVVFASIPFHLSSLRVRAVFSNVAAQYAIYLIESNGDRTVVKEMSKDLSFTFAVPQRYSTLPFPYVRNVSVLVQVQAEDGSSLSQYPLMLAYANPSTLTAFGNVSLSFNVNQVLFSVPFTTPLTVNTTRLSCSVPFSSTVLTLSASALQYGTVQASVAGQALLALNALGRREFNFNSSTNSLSFSVQATAQDGVSTLALFIDVTRAPPSNSTAATARLFIPSPSAATVGNNVSSSNARVEVTLTNTGGFNYTCAVPFNTPSATLQLTTLFPYAAARVGSAGVVAAAGSLVAASNTFALSLGKNVLTGQVIAENGLVAPVYVTVTMLPGNANATLKEIFVRSLLNDTSVRFTSSQIANTSALMTASLAYAVERIFITVTPFVSSATLSVTSGPTTVALVAGTPTAIDVLRGVASELVVRCVSESGTVSTVARIALARRSPSTNAQLQTLAFGQFTPTTPFSPTILTYSLPVVGVAALPIVAVLPSGILYSKVTVGLVETDSSPFISEATSLKIQWTIDDLESGLKNATALSVGTFPWATDLFTSRSDTPQNTLAYIDFALPANMTNGLPIGASVLATNTLNVSIDDDSTLLTLDTSPPSTATAFVVCPAFTASISEVTCAWYGFSDLESPISHYLFSVGLFPGDDSLFTSTFIGWTHHFTALVTLTHGMRFYVTVTAINSVGLSAQVSSSVISVDLTPPTTSGHVWELDDFLSLDWVTRDTSLLAYTHANATDFEFNTAYKLGTVVRYQGRLYRATSIFDSQSLDPVRDRANWAYLEDSQCQKGRSRLFVQWDAFEDPDSGLDHYELAFGTTLGGGDLTQGWITVSANTTSAVIVEDALGNDLVLPVSTFVYVSIKAVNRVNLSSTRVSNGVGIAAPQVTGSIVDGLDADRDADYQNSPRVMSAVWTTNDPCPVVLVETMIVRADDFVVQPWTILWNESIATPATATAPTWASLEVPSYMEGAFLRTELQNGRKYFLFVRLTNFMQQQALLATNGVVVQIEPPAAGTVYDGPFEGQDINIQASLLSFSASWYDCLLCARAATVCPTCFGSARSDSGQSIVSYAAALGSNPRYDATKANVVPFVNVALNTSVTFNLTTPLTPGTLYYITVRGYSMPDVYTEAISNGIAGGFSLGLLAGTVSAPLFVSNLSTLTATWTGFDSPLLIYEYQVEIVSAIDPTVVLVPLTSAGTATSFTFTNLTMLQHNSTYLICVTAIDQALMQNSSCTPPILIDLTPPCAGQVLHRASSRSPRLTVSYEGTLDQINILWQGFDDPESGLDAFSVSLLSSTQCNVLAARNLSIANQTTQCALPTYIDGPSLALLSWMPVGNSSVTRYTYQFVRGETLLPNAKYVILVRATNRAGLSIIAASPIVILDESGPQAGRVVDGTSFFDDWRYQNSNTSIHATFTHAFRAIQLPCPRARTWTFTGPDAAWEPVTRFCRAGMCNDTMPTDNQILGDDVTMDPRRVAYDSQGMTLSMVHPREGISYSGAIFSQLSGPLDGEYEFVLSASAETNAINSIVFWGEDPVKLREPRLFVPAKPSEPAFMMFPSSVAFDENGEEVVTGFSGNALGIQLRNIAGVGWVLVVWSSSRASSTPMFKFLSLAFDPSDGPHVYRIVLQSQLEVGVGSQGDLFIDDEWMSRFFSFPAMNDARVGFALSTEDLAATAVPIMRVVSAALPLRSARFCQAGEPFYDNTSAIVQYEWAVGTLRDPITKLRLDPSRQLYLDDIMPFTTFASPTTCRPCLPERPCDQGECDPTCVANTSVAVTVANFNMSLSAGNWFARCRWVRLGGTCLSVCPAGSTYLDSRESLCKPCHEQCVDGCLGPLPSDCRRCANLKQDGVCVGQCEVGYFDNGDGLCVPCNNQCLLTPIAGCHGPTAADCDLCRTVSKKVDGVATCVSACPPLHYAQGIFNLTFANATSTAESVRIIGADYCVPCHPSCGSSCFGPNASDCNDCKTVRNLTMTVEQWVASGEDAATYTALVLNNPPRACTDECPVGSYLDGDAVCRPCHDSCAGGCLGPAHNDCLFCPRFTDSNTRACVDHCAENQFSTPSGACYNCSSARCASVTPSNVPTPASFTVNPYGNLQFNARLLTVDMATSLAFHGGTGCKKVVRLPSGRLEDADFVNITNMNASSESAVFPMAAPEGNATAITKYRLRVRAQDGVSMTEYIVRAIRAPPSPDNVLSDLQVFQQSQPVTLSPPFAPGVYVYTASVTAGATSLQVVCSADSFATISGATSSDGPYSVVKAGTLNLTLPSGAPGSVSVSVVSESGVANPRGAYTIRLTRRPASTNALLNALTVLATATDGPRAVTLVPAFDPGISVYTAALPFRTVNVSAQVAVSEPLVASVTVNGASVVSSTWSPPMVFATTSTLTIVVASELGMVTKSYTVTLTRMPRSSNAALRAFSVTAPSGIFMDPSFKADVFAYNVFAIHSERTFTLASVAPLDAGATLTTVLDNQPVQVGSSLTGSLLVLTVTSEDGTVSSRTNITLGNLPPSAINSLADARFTFLGVPLVLTCGGLNQFVSSESDCTVQLPATAASLVMWAAVSDNFSSLQVLGEGVPLGSPGLKLVNAMTVNIPLSVATYVIAVNVTAESGAVQQYTFAVTRAALSSTPFLQSVSTSVGGLNPDLSNNVSSYVLNATLDDESFTFTATAIDTVTNITLGYLVNRDNSSATVESNCVDRVVTLAQCAVDPCVIRTDVTIDNNGVFGFLGFTTTPRVVRNTTRILSRGRQKECVLTTLTSTYTTFISVSALSTVSFSFAFDKVALGLRIISTAENRVSQYFSSYFVVRVPSSDTSFGTMLAAFTPASGVPHETTFAFDSNNTVLLNDRTAEVNYLDESVNLTLTPAFRGTRFVAYFRPSGSNITQARVRNATRSDSLRFPLAFGVAATRIVVVVTAADGVTVRNYTIIVSRPAPSTTSTLSGLELRTPVDYSLTPQFFSLFREYSIIVPYTMSSFTLFPLLTDPTAAIEFGRDLSADGVPPPLPAGPGEMFVGYCVVSSGYGFVSANLTSGNSTSRQRTGTWPLAAMLSESGITLTNGFVGNPAAPAPTPRCDGAADLCAQCVGVLSSSGRCLASCPSRTFANTSTNVCEPCHATCARDCVGGGATDCLTDCQNVSTISLTGDAPTTLFCTKCLGVMFQNRCLLGACPTGFYADSSLVCQPCHSECDGGCIGPSPTQCTRCSHLLHISSNSTRQEGFCTAQCDVMHYRNEKDTCMPCNFQCMTGCTGGGADQCLPPATVTANVSSFGCANYSLNKTCVTMCPHLTYADYSTKVCEPCPAVCGNNGCTGPTMRDCIRVRNKESETTIAGPIQDTFFVPGTYFVSIRATDAANNVIYSTSSGVIVDYTPPELTKEVFHADPARDADNPEATLFMSNNETMIIGWDFQDLESSISSYQYCVGSSNATCDLINWTSSGRDELENDIKVVTVQLPMLPGRTYFARVCATNNAGLNVTVASSGVTIDRTPPTPGTISFVDPPVTVMDGIRFFADESTMAITWTAFVDPESGISAYDWAIGLSPETAEVLPWTPVGKAGSTHVRVKGNLIYTDPNMVRADRSWESPNSTIGVIQTAPFRLMPGVVYYNNLRGWNGAYLQSGVSSQPFIIKRLQDQLLTPAAVGDFSLFSGAFTRREILDMNHTQVMVSVPPGAISANALLTFVPLSEADYTATYTIGTGQQLDLFARENYEITVDTYIHDPTLPVLDARQVLVFSGVTFGVAPVTIDDAPVDLDPISVRARVPTTWNQTAFRPRWMYWNVEAQTWDSVAALCGPTFSDTISDLSQPFANISAPICNPARPVLPDCPNTTQSCQTIDTMGSEDVPCVFPFLYNNTNYTQCTTVDSPTGQPWCGTASRVTGSADWGFCNCNATGYCLTTGYMAPRGTPCAFPFTHGGVTYNTCAAGLGGNRWCATESTYSNGNWGTCSCFDVTYEEERCRLPGANRTLPSGPSKAVQIALMFVATDTACAAPVVRNVVAGPFSQGYSRSILLRLNTTEPYGDPTSYQLVSSPTYGVLDTSRLLAGILKFRLASTSQFFYGNDTFTYVSQQTGLTRLGQLSPCVPRRSNDGIITVMISNVNDAPTMVLDLFAQPTDTLLNIYGNNSDSRFVFELTLPEDTPFDIMVLVQDHDLDDTFDFRLLQGPALFATPAWVLNFTKPYLAGTVNTTVRDRHTWTEFGVESEVLVRYTPTENYFGSDSIRFTVRDVPGPGLAALLASSAPFEFRFTITPVNDVPFALTQTVIIDSGTGRQGTPFSARLMYYDIETPPANLTLRFPTRNLSFDQYNMTVVPDNETYSVLTQQGGRVTLLPTNETGPNIWVRFLYTPPGGAYGATDTFTYVVSDGNATSAAAVVTISYPQSATKDGLAPAVVAAIVILIIVVLATVVALVVLRQRSVRKRKVSLLGHVQAVESDKVFHATDFPLWTGPLEALEYASGATAQHDMYVPRLTATEEPTTMLVGTKTMLKSSKRVDLAEDRGDHLVLPAERERPAHTTYVDQRMGLSPDALMEIENPLYVSDRTLTDWSQRYAYDGAPARDFHAVRGLGRKVAQPNPTPAASNAPTPAPPGVLDESAL